MNTEHTGKTSITVDQQEVLEAIISSDTSIWEITIKAFLAGLGYSKTIKCNTKCNTKHKYIEK